ncbi:MAG: inositol monophosphatase family protein [Gaiellaceae bacterium]
MADADLAFALELAELADSLSVPRFRAVDLQVETKPDLTPVTDADRAVERALRERIAAQRPGDSVLGEEEGDDGGPVRWIVDPIDGTRNFSRGLPVWATLIALERDGAVTCGVVSAPALGHRWWATRGEGAWRDGERIAVSRVTTLGDAAASCSEAADLALLEPRAWHTRGLGDFWQHVLVAEGALDVAVDSRLALWDYAAVALVVQEAGGRSGAPDGGRARPNEQLVSTNGLVHDEVLGWLSRA